MTKYFFLTLLLATTNSFAVSKCIWLEKPRSISHRSIPKKLICIGKVYCTSENEPDVTAQAKCFQETAGANCESASACANAKEDNNYIKYRIFNADVVQGNPIERENRDKANNNR